jgi:hypothetical protein
VDSGKEEKEKRLMEIHQNLETYTWAGQGEELLKMGG